MYGVYYGYSLATIYKNNIIHQENQTKSHNCQGTHASKLVVSSDGTGNVKAIPDRLSRIETRDEGINYVEEKITNKLDILDKLDNIDKYHRLTKYDDILHT